MLKALFKYAIIISVLLVLCIGGAFFFAPNFIKKDDIVGYISPTLMEKAYLKMVVHGDASISIIPNLSIKMQKVELHDIRDNTIPPIIVDELHAETPFKEIIFGKLFTKLRVVLAGKDVDIALSTEQLTRLRNGESSDIELVINSPKKAVIAGSVRIGDDKIVVSDLKVNVENGTQGVINADIAHTQVPPSINAKLKFALLQVNDFIEIAEPFGALSPKAPVAEVANEEVSDTPFAWSNEPIDLSGLKAVNGNIAFSIDKLIANEIEVGTTEGIIDAKEGNVRVQVKKLVAYDGVSELFAGIDSSLAKPEFRLKAKLDGIQLGDFLTDSKLYGKFSGLNVSNINLVSTGNSEQELITNLNGSGDIKLEDAKILGIDMANLSKMEQKSMKAVFKDGTDVETNIKQMSASFTVENGVVQNKDLKINLPVSALNGEGKVNLAEMKLNYRVTPILGVSQVGVRVPIRISGNLVNPLILPDLTGLATQGLDKKILSPDLIKNMAGGVAGVLGRSAQDPNGQVPSQQELDKAAQINDNGQDLQPVMKEVPPAMLGGQMPWQQQGNDTPAVEQNAENAPAPIELNLNENLNDVAPAAGAPRSLGNQVPASMRGQNGEPLPVKVIKEQDDSNKLPWQ